MMIVFLVIMLVGLVFLVLTWIVGELFDFGHDVADFFGGHEVDVGGHEIHVGGAEAAHDTDHGPSFLSSRVVFTFLTAFGAGGAGASQYGLGPLLSSGVGFVTGFAIAAIVFAVSRWMFGQQSTGALALTDLVGVTGYVTISIPNRGQGQVTVSRGGTSLSHVARSADASAVASGTSVIVEAVHGDVLVVRAAPLAAKEVSA